MLGEGQAISELEQMVTIGERWKGSLRLGGDPWGRLPYDQAKSQDAQGSSGCFLIGHVPLVDQHDGKVQQRGDAGPRHVQCQPVLDLPRSTARGQE